MSARFCPPSRWLPSFRQTGIALVLWLVTSTKSLAAFQTITWTDPQEDVLRVGHTYPLNASASSGLSVTFRVAAGPALIGNGTVTVTNTGTVVLIAEQAGDANYSPANLKRRVNQVAVQVTPVGAYDTPGVVLRVEVVGNRAYLSDGEAGVQILDVSDPTSPVLVGSSSSKTHRSVQVVGNLAFVAGSDAGFEILDVSNPASPTRIGSSDRAGFDVQVVDGLAFLAAEENGLVVLDVTNPAAPTFVSSYLTNANPRGVKVVDNLVFVAGEGLQILSRADPAALVQLGSYPARGSAIELSIKGNLALVASSQEGMLILDVSSPSSPTLLSSYPQIEHPEAVQFVDQLAFVVGYTFGPSPGSVILDLSDPTTPTRVGEFPSTNAMYDVKVVGNFAYVAAGRSGLLVFRFDQGVRQTLDWTRPVNGDALLPGESMPLTASASSGLPVTFRVIAGPGEVNHGVLTVTDSGTVVIEAEQAGDATFLPVRATRAVNPVGVRMTPVGSYDSSGHSFGVQVKGNLAYLADGEGGLKVVDVSDPTTPVLLGSYDPGDDTFTVEVVGDLAYLAADAAGLVILDVSNPSAPRLLGQNLLASEAYVVRVAGDLAYVADNTNGLLIFDVSDPAAPKLVSTSNLGPAFSVQPVGDLAYVAGPGLIIFNIKHPEAPTLASRFRVSVAHDVQIIGNLAFVAKGDGLDVVDVRHAPGPWFVGSYRIPVGYGFAVHVVDNLAFIASEGGGLHVADVSQPGAPRAAGSFRSTFSWDVQVVGDLVYLADSTSGLRILRVEKRIAQTLPLALPSRISLRESPLSLPPETVGGLPVSYQVVTGPAQIVDRNQLTLVGEGRVVIRAEQPGDEVFEPFTVEQSFTAFIPLELEPIRLVAGRVILSWTGGTAPFSILKRDSLTAMAIRLATTSERIVGLDVPSTSEFYQVRDSR